jgi:adenosine kinase
LLRALRVLSYAELAAKANVEYIAGGAAQNTIRVTQWMLQSAGATGYVGCIGKDDFGNKLKAASQGDGVTTHFLEDAKVPTGTCAVCVVDKDRYCCFAALCPL